MACFALEDKTGKSEFIIDPEIKSQVAQLRAVEPDFEVQEVKFIQKRIFRSPVEITEYRLFFNVKVGFGQWQLIQCASGRKDRLMAYIYGYLQAHDDIKKGMTS